MDDSPGTMELLSTRVDELEKRVHALEHPGEARIEKAAQPVESLTVSTDDGASALETGNTFPIIGRAMLGIAGAYVLRAVAEAGILPKLPVAAIAVAYAFAWLVWSSRISVRLASIVYAGTSVVILAPLLWENTLSFRVLSQMASAGVLAAFITLATVRARAKGGMWLAQTVAMMTAGALAFATHQVLPFITAMLIGALVVEFARSRQYAQPAWPWIALLVDAAIWGFIFIYAGPQNARVEYPELRAIALIVPGCALFAICGTGAAVRSIGYGERIGVFDVVQAMIAFVLAVAGVLYFAPPSGVVAWGVTCLTLSAGLYVAAFQRLRQVQEPRNLRIFGAWGAAMLIAGSLWALPHSAAAILLAIAAVVAIFFAERVEPQTLMLHGALFLAAGSLISGLPRFVFDELAGSSRRSPDVTVLSVTLCAAVAVFVERRITESLSVRVMQFIPVLVATCALVSLFVYSALSGAGAVVALDVHHVAFLRTLTICIAALGLAFGGSRWGRSELTHLAYAVLAFVAAKLLFEDLRHGHMEFIAGSIALFAVALIAAPRLVRLGARLHATALPQNVVHGNR